MAIFSALAQANATLHTPMPLVGLWAMSLGADFSYTPSDDLEPLYGSGALNVPESQLFPGLNASFRHHFHDHASPPGPPPAGPPLQGP